MFCYSLRGPSLQIFVKKLYLSGLFGVSWEGGGRRFGIAGVGVPAAEIGRCFLISPATFTTAWDRRAWESSSGAGRGEADLSKLFRGSKRRVPLCFLQEHRRWRGGWSGGRLPCGFWRVFRHSILFWAGEQVAENCTPVL